MTQPSQGPLNGADLPTSSAPDAHTGNADGGLAATAGEAAPADAAPAETVATAGQEAPADAAPADAAPAGTAAPADAAPAETVAPAGTVATAGQEAPADAAPAGTAAPAQTVGQATAGQQTGGSGKHQAVLGPFTPRDLTVFGSTLIMFIASLLPMFGGRYNLWSVGNLFFLALGILLPVVVAALFVARRLQPGTIVRIGSLSIDQFASVVASFAVALFFLTTAESFSGSVFLGLVGALGFLAATVVGPYFPYLSEDFKERAEVPAHVVAREAAVPTRKPAAPKPPKAPKAAKADQPSKASAGRAAKPSSIWASGAPIAGVSAAGAEQTGTPASATASEPALPTAAVDATQASAVVPSAAESTVVPPAAESTVVPSAAQASTSVPATVASTSTQSPEAMPADSLPATMASPVVPPSDTAHYSAIDATVDPSSRADSGNAPHYEAFWFAVAQPRTAVDEGTGAPVFTIEPGGWVLALEDRGHEFLVQHSDGRVGVLRDLSHIERG